MIEKIINMKIATRLIISFVSIIVIFILAIAHANYTVTRVNNLHRHNVDYVVSRADYVLYINQEFMSIKQLSVTSVMDAEWRANVTDDSRRGYEQELTEHFERIEHLAQMYIQSIMDDPGMYAGDSDYAHIHLITYTIYGSRGLFDIMAEHFFLDGVQSYDDSDIEEYSEGIYSALRELRSISLAERENALAEINDTVFISGIISALVSAVFLLSAFGIAVTLSKSYKRNIADLENHIALVGKGDFKAGRQALGRHEISNMLAKLTDAFTGLIDNINTVADDIKNNRENVHINSECFEGSYKEAALAINTLIDTLVESKERELGALAQLNDANERAKIIFDKSPFPISFWTFSGDSIKITDINDSFMDMFGVYDRDKLLNEFPQNFTPGLQPCGTLSGEYIMEYTQKAVEKGSYKFDLMHHDIHGLPVPCEIVSVSANFYDSHVLIAYARDMRDIFESQKKIREANERVLLMLDSTPIACFLIDNDFKAIDCNMEAVSLFGLREKSQCISSFDWISRCSECVDEQRRCENIGMDCRLKAQYYKALAEGSAKIEWDLQMPDRSKSIPCEISYVRLVHKDDFVVAAYINDLRTRNKLIEDARKLEIAEENNMAKSQFLANVSHEIRTPLNAILGITEIHLQKTDYSQETREAFEKIYVSGDMLLGIINDILDLSKIEAGKMELAPEKYEIMSMIHDTIALNMMRIESKPVKFEISVEETVPAYLLGDELRVKQVINNILSNAFKYTNEGLVEMLVRADEDGDDPTHITLNVAISDTGQGMSKEQVDKIFESYSRFNVNTNRFIEGSGLGMSIARDMINLMEGDILVESEVGKGSTFTIRIPQIRIGDDDVGKEATDNLNKLRFESRIHMKRGQITQEPMPYGRVLVVDDVGTNIYVARGLLSPYELQVDSVESGLAAIKKIESGDEFDIIFMDHMMPQMDGIETTQRLRAMGYTLPIVALTANAIAGQSDVFLKSGFDDFISKPIDIRMLDIVLNKLIRDKQPPEVIRESRAKRVESRAAHPQNSDDFGGYMKSAEFYDMAYKEFGRSQKNITQDLTRAIETDDIKEAHFLIHTLMGMAGLIGEDVLVRLAQEAEVSLHKGVMPKDCIDMLIPEVERVLNAIGEMHPQKPDLQPDVLTLDKDKARNIFDRLDPLLKEGSFGALDLINELANIPLTSDLISQIGAINFEAAQKTLVGLRKILEV